MTELNLAEGRHQIVVRNSDFPPFTRLGQRHRRGRRVTVRHKFGS